MGVIFKGLAIIIYTVAGLWGLAISLGIISDHFGFIGGIIAFFIAPVTLSIAPWYEGIANSNWFPLILIYGGGIAGYILYTVGSAIDGDEV